MGCRDCVQAGPAKVVLAMGELVELFLVTFGTEMFIRKDRVCIILCGLVFFTMACRAGEQDQLPNGSENIETTKIPVSVWFFHRVYGCILRENSALPVANKQDKKNGDTIQSGAGLPAD